MAQLTCVDCGTKGPGADRMPEARTAAERDGWMIGRRGSGSIAGWEDDFCPACKVSHPRIYCDGYKKRTCDHRALILITRSHDGMTARTCGSHMSTLLTEIVRGGKCEVEEIPA